jgi:hypothetical protein
MNEAIQKRDSEIGGKNWGKKEEKLRERGRKGES